MQDIRLVDGRNSVQAYSYRLQLAEERNTWILRWEYHRDRPKPEYTYPRAHLHLNGSLGHEVESHLDKPPPHLHIPTRRVALEAVLWHVIAEWGVVSRTDDWESLLTDSISGFDARRQAE